MLRVMWCIDVVKKLSRGVVDSYAADLTHSQKLLADVTYVSTIHCQSSHWLAWCTSSVFLSTYNFFLKAEYVG